MGYQRGVRAKSCKVKHKWNDRLYENRVTTFYKRFNVQIPLLGRANYHIQKYRKF